MAELNISGKVVEIRTRDGKAPEVKLAFKLELVDVYQLQGWLDAGATLNVHIEAQATQLPLIEPTPTPNLRALADGVAGETQPLWDPEGGSFMVDGDRLPVLKRVGDPDPDWVYRLTGSEIRSLAEPNVEADVPLWVLEFDLQGDEERQAVMEVPTGWRQVGDTELLEIKDGMQFRTGFRDPGADEVDGPLASAEGADGGTSTDSGETEETGDARDPVEAVSRRRANRGAFSVVPQSEPATV